MRNALRVKFVIDTNVLISGALWDGLPVRLLDAWENGSAEVILSPELLEEFAYVVSRPKLAARLALRGVTPQTLVLRLRREVVPILPQPLSVPAELRDRRDLHVLEAAVSGQVDAIVSGDDDLLAMKNFEGIPILNVRETLERLGPASA
ncbi:putative toxin-antitoxin system toxin component, PIN family [soil metagenome]